MELLADDLLRHRHALRRAIDSVASRGAAGVVGCTVANGRIIASAAEGTADRARSARIRENATFDMASQTKLLTCVAVLRIIEAGRLSLSTPITDVIDASNFSRPDLAEVVTVNDLIRHQGGFGHTTRATALVRPLHASGLSLQRRRAGAVAITKNAPLGFDYMPRCDSQYSNVGYALMADIVERITERNFADAIDELVLQPLHMTGTDLSRSARPDVYRHRRGGRLGFDFFPRWKGIAGGTTTIEDLGRLIAPFSDDSSDPRGLSKYLALDEGEGAHGHTIGWRRQRSESGTTIHQAGSRPGLSVKAMIQVEAGVGCVLMANASDRVGLHAASEGLLGELCHHAPELKPVSFMQREHVGDYRLTKRLWQAPTPWLDFHGGFTIRPNRTGYEVISRRQESLPLAIRDRRLGFVREGAWIPIEFVGSNGNRPTIRLGGPYTGIEFARP